MNIIRQKKPTLFPELLLITIACLFTVIFTPAPVRAQIISHERRSSAQIRQSREADTLIKEAVSSREDGDLRTFVENLQKAREKYKNWLVPVRDENGLFVGVRKRTEELLLSLKREGRKLYRNRYEQNAREAIREAMTESDPSEVYDAADRYPLTKSARKALDKLFLRRFKEGEFDRAVTILRRLYQLQYRDKRKAKTARKIAFCLSELGRVDELDEFVSSLPNRIKTSSVTWDGNNIKLTSFLKRRIKSAKRQIDDADPDSPGSDRSRSSNFTQPASPSFQPRNVQSEQLKPEILFPIPGGATRQFRHRRIRRNRVGLQQIKGFYPLITGETVLLNNGISCWGWNLTSDSGSPLTEPSWTVSDEDIDGSQVMKDVRLLFRGSSSGDGNYYCSLVTELGKSEKQMLKLQVRFPVPWRSLFSIDVSEGTVNWKRGGPDGKGFLKNASFPSGAIHKDGILYSSAVKFQTSKDTPNIYGTALDADTGEVLWKTFLTKNMLGTNLFENPIREVVTDVPVVGEQNVYLSTNTGVIAALDRETGTLQWLYRYVQWRFPDTQSIYPKRQTTFWQNNVPLLTNDTLLFTPTDSLRLIAVDRHSGKLKWKQDQTSLESELNGFARWMVPLRDGRYLLSSKNGFAIFSGSTGKQLSRPFMTSTPVEGRPAALERHIGLPTTNGIKLVEYHKPRNQEMLELSESGILKPKLSYKPGNTFFTENALLLAGPEQFAFYRILSN